MELFNSANDERSVEPVQQSRMDYTAVFKRVIDFAKSRRGLYVDPDTPTPQGRKIPTLIEHKNNLIARDITGGLCYCAYKHNLGTEAVVTFLDKVEDHVLVDLPEHKVTVFEDILPMSILTHPMYAATQQYLPYAVPGTAQMGPGEFQFCFFDAASHYVVDPTAGYDIAVTSKNHRVELKKHGTRLTCDPEKLDQYAQEQQEGKLDKFMVYKPISNKSLNPVKSGKFIMMDLVQRNWREFLEYGKAKENPGLMIKKDLL